MTSIFSLMVSSIVVCLALSGCGNLFVDESIINKAKKDALNPRLSSREKAKIYEDAGDASRRNGQGGFAAELYFDAANNYNGEDTSGDNDVLRVYGKCNKSNSECRSIKDIIIDEWRTRSSPINQANRNNTASPSVRTASAQGGEVELFAYCRWGAVNGTGMSKVYFTPVYQVRGYEFSDWRMQKFSEYQTELFNRYAKANLGMGVNGTGSCGFNREKAVMEILRSQERALHGGSSVDIDYDRPKAPIQQAPQPSNRTVQ